MKAEMVEDRRNPGKEGRQNQHVSGVQQSRRSMGPL